MVGASGRVGRFGLITRICATGSSLDPLVGFVPPGAVAALVHVGARLAPVGGCPIDHRALQVSRCSDHPRVVSGRPCCMGTTTRISTYLGARVASAVVRELHSKVVVLSLDQGDDLLEVVALLAGHPELVSL